MHSLILRMFSPIVYKYRLEHSKRDLTDIDTLENHEPEEALIDRGRSPRSINVSEGE